MSLPRLAGLVAVAALAGCSGAPALNIVGSYFPAWMLCAIIGVLVALGVRALLVMCDVEGTLKLPFLTHLAIALTATLLVWLLCFGH